MRMQWLLVGIVGGIVGLSSACSLKVGLWTDGRNSASGDIPSSSNTGGAGGSGGAGGAGGMANSSSSSNSASGSGGMAGGAGAPLFWENHPNHMYEARQNHTMTKLADGRILIAGGYNSNKYPNATASAEIWDPQTNEFQLTNPMNRARAEHVATLLPNGGVIVTGGANELQYLNSIEIYIPDTNNWIMHSATLTVGRVNHAALVLPNDTLLLAAGDWVAPLQTAETIAPLAALPFQPVTVQGTGNLQPIYGTATLTLLPNDQALLIGNIESTTPQWYDYSSKNWLPAGSLNLPRNDQTANLRASGRLVVAGGTTLVNNMGPQLTNSVEEYDFKTNQWTLLPPMQHARRNHSGTLVTIQGQEDIVWVGGMGADGGALASCERASGYPCPNLNVARTLHRALVVSVNGEDRVMVTGGLVAGGQPTNSVEWLRW